MKPVLSVLLSSILLATSVHSLKCHECVSTSASDSPCTSTDLGKVTDNCASCTTTKLDTNRYVRVCLSVHESDSCGVVVGGLDEGKAICWCNTDLCNAEDFFNSLIRCHTCESKSVADPNCTERDFGEVKDGCGSCSSIKLDENTFKRTCMSTSEFDGCGLVAEGRHKGKIECWCNEDLCNAKIEFKPLIKCYACKILDGDPHCTDFDIWEEVDGCATCASEKLGENTIERSCMSAYLHESCWMSGDNQACVCNTPLCNANIVFKTLIKCHVCESVSAKDKTCTDFDFGKEVDECFTCTSHKLGENRYKRECLSESMNDLCLLKNGVQKCYCNTALCNANDIFRNVLKCYECDIEATGKGSCDDRASWRQKDGCLTCNTAKAKENMFSHGCMESTTELGCYPINRVNMCFCDTELCNVEDIYLPIMMCFVCEPQSKTDKRCNVRNSKRTQHGCLTCGTSVNKNGIKRRFCLNYALAPSNKTENGKVYSYCNTDKCNGEGDEKVSRVDPASHGLQMAVSSRMIIGVLTGILGLARRF